MGCARKVDSWRWRSHAGCRHRADELAERQDHLLLRFFDFTVEPGKKYKYQVQLVLADPNYPIPENQNALAPEVLDRRAKEAAAARVARGPTSAASRAGAILARRSASRFPAALDLST